MLYEWNLPAVLLSRHCTLWKLADLTIGWRLIIFLHEKTKWEAIFKALYYYSILLQYGRFFYFSQNATRLPIKGFFLLFLHRGVSIEAVNFNTVNALCKENKKDDAIEYDVNELLNELNPTFLLTNSTKGNKKEAKSNVK